MEVIIEYLLPLSYLFSALLVALYAIYVFNIPEYPYGKESVGEQNSRTEVNEYTKLANPSLPKYMTEKSRYYFFLSVFVVISIALYTILGALLPGEIASFIGFANPDAASFFIAALIIIGITGLGTTKYDWVKYLLIGPIRGWMHDYAEIPKKGRDLFYVITNSDIRYQDPVGKQLIEETLKKELPNDRETRQDLTVDDFNVGNRDTIAWKSARLAYCMNVIEEGSKHGAFQSQLNEESLGWHRIHTEYKKCIGIIIKKKNNALAVDEEIALNNRLKELLANTYRLMSCLLFMVSHRDEDPVTRLQGVGFDVTPEQRYSIPSKEVVRVVGSVVLAIFLLSMLANLFTPITFNDQLVYLASAFAILVVPIIIVIAVKKRLCRSGIWPIAMPDKHYDRPVLVYIATLFVAWSITTGLMILLTRILIKLDYPEIDADNIYLDMLVYSSLSALTAFFAAYRIDIPPRVFKSKLRQNIWRITGGMVQGTFTASLTWMCLMMDKHQGQIYPAAELSAEEWSKLVLYLVMAFATGFMIFVSLFFEKHHYEKRRETRKLATEKVQAIIKGEQQVVTIENISNGGAGIRVAKNLIQPTGSLVKLLLDGRTRGLAVVKSQDDGRMNLSYIYGR